MAIRLHWTGIKLFTEALTLNGLESYILEQCSSKSSVKLSALLRIVKNVAPNQRPHQRRNEPRSSRHLPFLNLLVHTHPPLLP